MIEEAEPFALTGVVVAEVLQGLTHRIAEIESYLSQWEFLEPKGRATYEKAAAIFRLARSKGFSLTTIDTIIAAIALEHGATLFTIDKDFSQVTRVMQLGLHFI